MSKKSKRPVALLSAGILALIVTGLGAAANEWGVVDWEDYLCIFGVLCVCFFAIWWTLGTIAQAYEEAMSNQGKKNLDILIGGPAALSSAGIVAVIVTRSGAARNDWGAMGCIGFFCLCYFLGGGILATVVEVCRTGIGSETKKELAILKKAATEERHSRCQRAIATLDNAIAKEQLCEEEQREHQKAIATLQEVITREWPQA